MAKANKFKFTRPEKSWIMYDWANSVYATNILAVIFPIYFGNVCRQNGADNLELWHVSVHLCGGYSGAGAGGIGGPSGA